jgi:hypothetical protein
MNIQVISGTYKAVRKYSNDVSHDYAVVMVYIENKLVYHGKPVDTNHLVEGLVRAFVPFTRLRSLSVSRRSVGTIEIQEELFEADE